MSNVIEYERKWVSGRDKLLDYLSSQLEKGRNWDFRIEEDDIVSDGYYVTSLPIVPEKPAETIWYGPVCQEAVVGKDGCFYNSGEAYYIWQCLRSGGC